MILVAHPDDESIASSVLLQRHTDAHVVYMTSGGLIDSKRLRLLGLSDAASYTELREEEAKKALSFGRKCSYRFLRYPDGSTSHYLREIFATLEDLITQIRPDAILTHAYEGAHEDHDCCSYLTSRCGAKHNIPCWEMPLYYVDCAKIIRQSFIDAGPTIVKISPSKDELLVKCRMILAHASQRGILRHFDPRLPEQFRPQAPYDFTAPAMPGMIQFGVSVGMIQGVLNKFREFEKAVWLGLRANDNDR